MSEVLERLAPVADDIVLIGGQAVHFWTTRYMVRVPELQREAPYTTKDIDFCGTAEQARACARVLDGKLREFTVHDRTPCSAIIELGDLQIDFLRTPYGLPDAREVRDRSVKYPYGRVMHPMHVLESRTANVADLPDYQTDRSRKQLRGAILCTHELLVDILEQSASDPRAVRSALRLSERIFSLAESRAGLAVHVDHGMDVLDSIVLTERMPASFRELRYPQAKARIEAKRLQLQRSIEEAADQRRAQPASMQQAPPPSPSARRGRKP